MQLPMHLVAGQHRAWIRLDGVLIEHVVEAHTGEGWIERMVRGVDGRIQTVGDEIQTERIYGAVTATPMTRSERHRATGR